ncbi:ATPase [Rhodobacterales bacterium 52_120_T64]|nr:ATPase [Rhodobacterales bacterium 52_120_T64]
MIYSTASDWNAAAHKRVALIGMSGLGKTYLSNMLREGGNWFHYSVDFRIGTRYMGEHIVDNFKREAMRNPFLRNLLRSDSIYIASNISFENLAPLSSYLGKPGDAGKDGIPFEDYVNRQRQHRIAEMAATQDTGLFVHKALDIYGYEHFISDTSGSICEVVDPNDAADPVLTALSDAVLPVWIRGSDDHTEELLRRFSAAPKPMYYSEDFLRTKWAEYLSERGVNEFEVDPDDFIRWGYAELLQHRLPVYAAMAKNWGVTIEANEVRDIRDAQDFTALIAKAIDRNI